jgi:hypothetical protein
MENEYTVEQRAEIAKKSMPPLRLDARQKRQVEELLYTLSEAGTCHALNSSTPRCCGRRSKW